MKTGQSIRNFPATNCIDDDANAWARTIETIERIVSRDPASNFKRLHRSLRIYELFLSASLPLTSSCRISGSTFCSALAQAIISGFV